MGRMYRDEGKEIKRDRGQEKEERVRGGEDVMKENDNRRRKRGGKDMI